MADDGFIIVENIELDFDIEAISAKMGGRKSNRAIGILTALAEEAMKVARPVAGARVSSVFTSSDEESRLDQKIFASVLLREKLEGREQAFPYLASEGREMAEWAMSYSGTERIFADTIERAALLQVRTKLENRILEQFGFELIAAMNPGSLGIWPITQQIPLFELLDPLPQRLGISLLPSFMMEPRHTVSEYIFRLIPNIIIASCARKRIAPAVWFLIPQWIEWIRDG